MPSFIRDRFDQFYTLMRWLPIAAMVATIVLRPSPLGVILSLIVLVASGTLLKKLFPQFWNPGRIQKLSSIPPTQETFHGYASNADREVGLRGEIAMGGPEYWDLLLRDGAILEGVCSDAFDLDGGRLRIALQQSRHTKPLLAYDVDAQRIYTIEEDYRGLTPEELMNQALADPLRDGSLVRQACSDAAKFVELHIVHGLRVSKKDYAAPPARLAHSLRNGRLLEARLLLPPDLRGARDPEQWLRRPLYRLVLDGRDAGLHVDTLDPVCESPDGSCFVLAGLQLDGKRFINGLWLAWHGAWHVVDSSISSFEPDPASGRIFFLNSPEARNDGTLRFQISTLGYGPEGRFPSKPAPPSVDLPVSWKLSTLSLPTENNYIAVKLPASR
jgi:hypothetical protein